MQQMINLDRKAKVLINHLIIDNKFSKWINDKIYQEFADEDYFNDKIDKMKFDLEQLKSAKEELKKFKSSLVKLESDTEVMSKRELDWWKATIEVIDNDPGYMKGRHSLYKNEFGSSITLNKFIDKLNEVRENDV